MKSFILVIVCHVLNFINNGIAQLVTCAIEFLENFCFINFKQLDIHRNNIAITELAYAVVHSFIFFITVNMLKHLVAHAVIQRIAKAVERIIRTAALATETYICIISIALAFKLVAFSNQSVLSFVHFLADAHISRVVTALMQCFNILHSRLCCHVFHCSYPPFFCSSSRFVLSALLVSQCIRVNSTLSV